MEAPLGPRFDAAKARGVNTSRLGECCLGQCDAGNARRLCLCASPDLSEALEGLKLLVRAQPMSRTEERNCQLVAFSVAEVRPTRGFGFGLASPPARQSETEPALGNDCVFWFRLPEHARSAKSNQREKRDYRDCVSRAHSVGCRIIFRLTEF